VKPLYAAAAAILILHGCGYVGEPMYPLLNIPKPVTDLEAIERGKAILYQFTLPALTTEGKLAKIGRIEIRAGEAPKGAFNREEWLSKAIELEAKPGDRGLVKGEFPAGPWVGRELILGVKVYGVNGRGGEWSNLVPITVVEPLSTATAVTATPVTAGVQVSWQSSAQQHRVLRRDGPDQPYYSLLTTVEANQWLDTTTEYGTQYFYVIQAVQKTGNREAESELSEAREVTPVDVFPPAIPAGLNAIAGTENIELVWERNTEPDLAGYRLYRAEGDGKLEKIADIPDRPSYSDRKVESGKRYRYAVSALDRSGNESKSSEPVGIVAP
jgi:hypothetical protein